MKITKNLINKIELAFLGSWWNPLMDGSRSTKPIKSGKYVYTAIERNDGYIIYRNDGNSTKYTKQS